MRLVRCRCNYCKRADYYFPEDLIQVFGDVDVDSLMDRMHCEKCKSRLDVLAVHPSGQELVGLRIRRLVYIKVHRVPVWRDN